MLSRRSPLKYQISVAFFIEWLFSCPDSVLDVNFLPRKGATLTSADFAPTTLALRASSRLHSFVECEALNRFSSVSGTDSCVWFQMRELNPLKSALNADAVPYGVFEVTKKCDPSGSNAVKASECHTPHIFYPGGVTQSFPPKLTRLNSSDKILYP